MVIRVSGLLALAISLGASPVFADPVVAQTAQLTLNGQTVTVHNLSGGDVYADVIENDLGTAQSSHAGAVKYRPVKFDIDAEGLRLLKPAIEAWTGQGKLTSDYKLAYGSAILMLRTATVSRVDFPACDGGHTDSGLISIELTSTTVTQSTGKEVGSAMAMTSARTAAGEKGVTGCQITVDGLKNGIVDSLDAAPSLHVDNASSATGIAYTGTLHPPKVELPVITARQHDVQSDGVGGWASDALVKHLNTRHAVTVTYLSGDAIAFAVRLPDSYPSRSALASNGWSNVDVKPGGFVIDMTASTQKARASSAQADPERRYAMRDTGAPATTTDTTATGDATATATSRTTAFPAGSNDVMHDLAGCHDSDLPRIDGFYVSDCEAGNNDHFVFAGAERDVGGPKVHVIYSLMPGTPPLTGTTIVRDYEDLLKTTGWTVVANGKDQSVTARHGADADSTEWVQVSADGGSRYEIVYVNASPY